MNVIRKQSYLAVGILLLSGGPVLADGLSYSYIQAGYQDVSIDLGNGPDIDGDGYSVAGSVAIADDWFIFAGYSALEFESIVDLDQLSVGGGYHSAISSKTDWYATLAYLDASLETDFFGSADDSGYGVSVGLRSMVSPSLELYGSVAYSDLGDGIDGTAFGAGLWYNVSGNLALGLGASFDEDATSYGVGLRLYFDK